MLREGVAELALCSEFVNVMERGQLQLSPHGQVRGHPLVAPDNSLN